MPRKLVQDGYRGWYGFESRYDTAIRNSLNKLWNQNARLGLVKGHHKKRITDLEEQEKAFEIKQKKEKRDTQMELVEMRAYGRVYRQYSFTAFSRSEEKRLEQERQIKEDLDRKKKEQTEKLKGSIESINMKTNNKRTGSKEKKVKDNGRECKDNNAARKSSLHDKKGRKEKLEDREQSRVPSKLQSLSDESVSKRKNELLYVSSRHVSDLGPSAEEEEKPGTENSDNLQKTKTPETQINVALIECPKPEEAAPPAKTKRMPSSSYGTLSSLFMTETIPEEDEDHITDTGSEELSDLNSTSTETMPESDVSSTHDDVFELQPSNKLDSGGFCGYDLEQKRGSVALANSWRLGLFRSYTFGNRKDSVAATSSFSQNNSTTFCERATDGRPKLWENSLTRNDRKSRVFPQSCRNGFRLRRMIDEKAGRLMEEWAPENVRKMKAKKILDKMSLPDIVPRQKPTSAIFREFKHNKETHGSLDQYHHVIKRPGLMPGFDVLKINE